MASEAESDFSVLLLISANVGSVFEDVSCDPILYFGVCPRGADA